MASSEPIPDTRAAGLLVGFALGGFFDGILLHQILQWHHLLSLVPGVGDLRAQVVADGAFHAIMYLVAIAGLAQLWRARAGLAAPGAGARLLGWVLAGFGAWHVVDALLSHWLLGIHRIRLDSPTPLAWDLGWLGAFGLVPLALGLSLARARRRLPAGMPGQGPAMGLALVLAASGTWAARAPADADTALVVFAPGRSDGAALAAIAAADAVPLTRTRGLWAVAWRNDARPERLYRRGALFVGTGPLAAGCLAWSRMG